MFSEYGTRGYELWSSNVKCEINFDPLARRTYFWDNHMFKINFDPLFTFGAIMASKMEVDQSWTRRERIFKNRSSFVSGSKFISHFTLLDQSSYPRVLHIIGGSSLDWYGNYGWVHPHQSKTDGLGLVILPGLPFVLSFVNFSYISFRTSIISIIFFILHNNYK